MLTMQSLLIRFDWGSWFGLLCLAVGDGRGFHVERCIWLIIKR